MESKDNSLVIKSVPNEARLLLPLGVHQLCFGKAKERQACSEKEKGKGPPMSMSSRRLKMSGFWLSSSMQCGTRIVATLSARTPASPGLNLFAVEVQWRIARVEESLEVLPSQMVRTSKVIRSKGQRQASSGLEILYCT